MILAIVVIVIIIIRFIAKSGKLAFHSDFVIVIHCARYLVFWTVISSMGLSLIAILSHQDTNEQDDDECPSDSATARPIIACFNRRMNRFGSLFFALISLTLFVRVFLGVNVYVDLVFLLVFIVLIKIIIFPVIRHYLIVSITCFHDGSLFGGFFLMFFFLYFLFLFFLLRFVFVDFKYEAVAGNKLCVIAIGFSNGDALVLQVKVNIVSHNGIGTQDTALRLIDVNSCNVVSFAWLPLHVMSGWDSQNDVVGVIGIKGNAGQSNDRVRIDEFGWVDAFFARQLDQNYGKAIQFVFGQLNRFVVVLSSS
mmetsp:Transcript_2667/g.4580  ORF Transcript_2667/g.4580 Transcript_2667/m.4580 type:complete len:309 (+) Transcript_2667:155-1081(+)